MNNGTDWISYHASYYRNDDTPISPITLYPALSSHTVEITVTADSIPTTWYTAGYLYQFLDDPNSTPFPKSASKHLIDVNLAHVIQLPALTDVYWLQYRPHRWYLWQFLKIRYYRYG